jgi:hypothetical protein
MFFNHKMASLRAIDDSVANTIAKEGYLLR